MTKVVSMNYHGQQLRKYEKYLGNTCIFKKQLNFSSQPQVAKRKC